MARKRDITPLSHDDIRAIRALRGVHSQAEIGRMFDRSQAVIGQIQMGRTYRYVTDAPPAPRPAQRKVDLADIFAPLRRPNE